MKRKKRPSNRSSLPSRHLFFPARHLSLRRLIPIVFLLSSLTGGFAPTQAASSDRQESKPKATKNQFLIFGTVFTPAGFALPDARIRVRRAQEKKWRWEAASDSRGEFAVHVPREPEYEMEVSAKGFGSLTRKVDAHSGDRVDLVFRLERGPRGGKK
jgi:carboxypeptidase family protein